MSYLSSLAAFEVLDSGQLWGVEFGGSPDKVSTVQYHHRRDHHVLERHHHWRYLRYDQFWQPALPLQRWWRWAEPGYSGRRSPWRKTIVASGGTTPAGAGQTTEIAVDRDGYVHLCWTGQAFASHLVEVYEYDTTAATITKLYDYSASTGYFANEGITVSFAETTSWHCAPVPLESRCSTNGSGFFTKIERHRAWRERGTNDHEATNSGNSNTGRGH